MNRWLTLFLGLFLLTFGQADARFFYGAAAPAASPLYVSASAVTGTGITSGSGYLNAGKTFVITLTMSESATITGGTVTLGLNSGATAIYASGSGSSSLVFSSTVASGQNTSKLAVTSVNLNGATIVDGSANVANMNGALMALPGTLQIITTAPVVASVSAVPSTASLVTGQSAVLTVTFSNPVTVSGGTPTMALNSGSTTAAYASGSGTASLAFNYTIGAGDSTAKLAPAASSAISLNSATIADLATNAAVLTGANGYVMAGTLAINAPPSISSVMANVTSGTYGTGAVIGVVLGFSQNVTLGGTGNPTINLNSGPSSVATYASGSGSNSWTFNYTVGSSDTANPLSTTTVNALTLGSATIKNAGGVALASTAPASNISFTGVVIGSAYSCPGAGGTHYYVAATGADVNNGTSPSSPWQTTNRVDSGTTLFKAGDCITFRGGDNFTHYLTLNYQSGFFDGNGTAYPTNVSVTQSVTNPIVINSSNFGGGTTANATITSDVGSYAASGCNSGVPPCVNGGVGSAAITLANFTGGYITGMTAVNGTGQGTGATTQGIAVLYGTNVTVTGNSANGFQFANGDTSCCAGQIRAEWGSNITITNNNVPGLGAAAQEGAGIYTRSQTGPVTIAGNTVSNIGGAMIGGNIGWTGNGITVNANFTGPTLVYSNKVSGSGGNAVNQCGAGSNILSYQIHNAKFYNNEVANSVPYNTSAYGCDNDGLDTDGDQVNVYVERNYSHGNYGLGITTCPGCAGETVWGPVWQRWNVSVNDGRAPGQASSNFAGAISNATLYFYGNTIIQNEPVTSRTHGVFGFGGQAGIVGPNSYIGGNIFGITAGNNFATCNNYGPQPNLASIHWGHNLYYLISGASFSSGADVGGNPPCGTQPSPTVSTSLAQWKTVTGDTTSTQGTPGFSGGDPASGSAQAVTWTPSVGAGPNPIGPDAYQLTHGSVALGSNVNPAPFVGSPATTTPDYYGAAIPNSNCSSSGSSGGSGYNVGADNGCY